MDTRVEKTNFDSHFFTQTQTTEQFNARLKTSIWQIEQGGVTTIQNLEAGKLTLFIPFLLPTFSHSPLLFLTGIRPPQPPPPPQVDLTLIASKMAARDAKNYTIHLLKIKL